MTAADLTADAAPHAHRLRMDSQTAGEARDTTASQPSRTGALVLGAIGVVYGDIGTSPLYAFKSAMEAAGGAPSDIFGILSLLFWSLMIVVSVKYVLVILRADNRGQGGVLALSTLAQKNASPGLRSAIVILGMLGVALFTGDSLITPAISVLSAVEGLRVAAPALDPYIIPITLLVLGGLFSIQYRGTHVVGMLFGPVMVAWFAVIGVLGFCAIVTHPEVLRALSPTYALMFLGSHGVASFFVLGSVCLAVTGGEALYADMGHFGRIAIGRAWLFFVLPCLVLNYFGQGALLLATPSALANPFYLLAPSWCEWPLLLLATAATVIASQAVISGSFSLVQQGIQLGYMPRREIKETSPHHCGQVYVPRNNLQIMVGVTLLILSFRTSDNLASAYGVSVVGAMTIDAVLAMIVALTVWQWRRRFVFPLFGLFIGVDLLFLSANLIKIPDGGWFPLVVAGAAFSCMYVWRKGRKIVLDRLYGEDAMTVEAFVERYADRYPMRNRNTAIFLTPRPAVIPHALWHNLKHNHVLHQRVIILCVKTADRPFTNPAKRIACEDLGKGFYRVTATFGFMETPDVPTALEHLTDFGIRLEMMETSYFVGRETLIPGDETALHWTQEPIFIALSKAAASPSEFFNLPANRVVELGTQVRI